MKSNSSKDPENKNKASADHLSKKGQLAGSAVSFMAVGQSQIGVATNQQGPIQLQAVQFNGLANYVTHRHVSGQLTQMDYNAMGAERQAALSAYLTAAALQSVNTMFHGNESGNLPGEGWESRECSRYIEFNLGFQAFNRVMYDSKTGALYLTPHYDGYVQITNPPAAAVTHMEAIALLNTGYVLRDFDVEKARDLATAWQKITAIHSYHLDQDALGM